MPWPRAWTLSSRGPPPGQRSWTPSPLRAGGWGEAAGGWGALAARACGAAEAGSARRRGCPGRLAAAAPPNPAQQSAAHRPRVASHPARVAHQPARAAPNLRRLSANSNSSYAKHTVAALYPIAGGALGGMKVPACSGSQAQGLTAPGGWLAGPCACSLCARHPTGASLLPTRPSCRPFPPAPYLRAASPLAHASLLRVPRPTRSRSPAPSRARPPAAPARPRVAAARAAPDEGGAADRGAREVAVLVGGRTLLLVAVRGRVGWGVDWIALACRGWGEDETAGSRRPRSPRSGCSGGWVGLPLVGEGLAVGRAAARGGVDAMGAARPHAAPAAAPIPLLARPRTLGRPPAHPTRPLVFPRGRRRPGCGPAGLLGACCHRVVPPAPWCSRRGGAGQFVDHLASEVARLGGRLLTDAPVSDLMQSEGPGGGSPSEAEAGVTAVTHDPRGAAPDRRRALPCCPAARLPGARACVRLPGPARLVLRARARDGPPAAGRASAGTPSLPVNLRAAAHHATAHRFRARYAIVAMPPHLTGRIVYSPQVRPPPLLLPLQGRAGQGAGGAWGSAVSASARAAAGLGAARQGGGRAPARLLRPVPKWVMRLPHSLPSPSCPSPLHPASPNDLRRSCRACATSWWTARPWAPPSRWAAGGSSRAAAGSPVGPASAGAALAGRGRRRRHLVEPPARPGALLALPPPSHSCTHLCAPADTRPAFYELWLRAPPFGSSSPACQQPPAHPRSLPPAPVPTPTPAPTPPRPPRCWRSTRARRCGGARAPPTCRSRSTRWRTRAAARTRSTPCERPSRGPAGSRFFLVLMRG